MDRDLYPESDAHIINNLSEFLDTTITTFLSTFERFLRRAYHIHFTPIIGHNTQISTSVKPLRLSAHVRFNIRCHNLCVLKNLADNLNSFIYSNVHTSDHDRNNYLTWTYIGKNTSYLRSIVDTSVYNKFRNFRMLYSSKWKANAAPLIPYKDSSVDIKDHLVLYYFDTAPTDHTLYEINHLLEYKADADYTKINNISIGCHKTRDAPDHLLKHSSNTFVDLDKKAIDNVRRALTECKEIHSLLDHDQIFFAYENHTPPLLYTFFLDKSVRYMCPYAQRDHSNNRSYFEYNIATRTAKYKCFNEDCKKHASVHGHYTFKLYHSRDALYMVNSHNAIDTLHCKQNIIQWDEQYSALEMRPYPLVPLCAIRGNMGSAKTKLLINDFLPKHCSDPATRCLFITYQRLLSIKYSFDLQDLNLGFLNYMDAESSNAIYHNKVIVCLDSLCKVQTRNFDFIILDEVTSVLLHFNSQHMSSKSSQICALLELLLLQARHVILLDACVDNTIVHDFTNYICQRKQIQPYYIRNTHIRPSNRHCTAVVNTDHQGVHVLKKRIIDHVLTLIDAGKRIVVTSSTKQFVVDLEQEILARAKNKTVLTYHSGNNIISKSTSSNLTASWSTADVLIYSPSISAGTSFEIPHFHELVAFIDNTFFTPPIDIVLQQMFRVRQLIDGNMTLFINNTLGKSLSSINYPITPEDVDQFLDADIANLSTYYPNDGINMQANIEVRDTQITYSKDKLSYILLRGILVNRNKSLICFEDILINTLRNDYNIPCKIETLKVNEDMIEQATKLMKRLKNLRNVTTFPFSPDVLINYMQFDELDKKEKRGEPLNDLEKQQKWVFHCAIELWGINPQYMDANFYDNYIGQATHKDIQKALDKFFQIQRCKDMLDNSVTEHIKRMKEKLEYIITSDEDYNIDLYKTNVRKYYTRLIAGHRFLDGISEGIDYKEAIKTGTSIEMDASVFHEQVIKYVKGLSESEYKAFITLFDDRDRFSIVSEVVKNKRAQVYLTNRVLKEAFGASIDNSKTKTEGYKKKFIQSRYRSTYKPSSLNLIDYNVTFNL
jgi:hypothetical protein